MVYITQLIKIKRFDEVDKIYVIDETGKHIF